MRAFSAVPPRQRHQQFVTAGASQQAAGGSSDAWPARVDQQPPLRVMHPGFDCVAHRSSGPPVTYVSRRRCCSAVPGGIVPGTVGCTRLHAPPPPHSTRTRPSAPRAAADAPLGTPRSRQGASGVHPGRGEGASGVHPGRGEGASGYTRVAAKAPLGYTPSRRRRLWGTPRSRRRRLCGTPRSRRRRLWVHPGRGEGASGVHPGRGEGASAHDRVRGTSGNDRLASPIAADLGWFPRRSDQRWSMTSTLTTVAPLASAIAGPFPATAPTAATPRLSVVSCPGSARRRAGRPATPSRPASAAWR